MPVPPPPTSCTGFVPGPGASPIPNPGADIGKDIYDDDSSSEIPISIGGEYEVVQDEYTGNTYYNIALKKDFFTNNSKAQYLMVELMNRTNNGCSNITWGDDTGNHAG